MNEMPKTSPEDEPLLNELAADEEYWDYLDEIEYKLGGAREWDNVMVGGGTS